MEHSLSKELLTVFLGIKYEEARWSKEMPGDVQRYQLIDRYWCSHFKDAHIVQHTSWLWDDCIWACSVFSCSSLNILLRKIEGCLLAIGLYSVSGVIIILYDVLLTFDREVEYVWAQNGWCFKFLKLAYLINRYGMCVLSIFFLDCELQLASRYISSSLKTHLKYWYRLLLTLMLGYVTWSSCFISLPSSLRLILHLLVCATFYLTFLAVIYKVIGVYTQLSLS